MQRCGACPIDVSRELYCVSACSVMPGAFRSKRVWASYRDSTWLPVTSDFIDYYRIMVATFSHSSFFFSVTLTLFLYYLLSCPPQSVSFPLSAPLSFYCPVHFCVRAFFSTRSLLFSSYILDSDSSGGGNSFSPGAPGINRTK